MSSKQYSGEANEDFRTVTTPIVLPWPMQSGLKGVIRALFDLGDQSSADFLRPVGEAALVSPDSVTWRVFKNPLSLFIGGVAAVSGALRPPIHVMSSSARRMASDLSGRRADLPVVGLGASANSVVVGGKADVPYMVGFCRVWTHSGSRAPRFTVAHKTAALLQMWSRR